MSQTHETEVGEKYICKCSYTLEKIIDKQNKNDKMFFQDFTDNFRRQKHKQKKDTNRQIKSREASEKKRERERERQRNEQAKTQTENNFSKEVKRGIFPMH